MATDEDLERILALAARARKLVDLPGWKSGNDSVIEAHGEACDNLWNELYRQLDARAATGDAVVVPKLPPDPRKELKKQIIAALKEEIPGMVASVIDSF